MARARIRFRAPGVKPGQTIGPLGPFRGRLGLHWVIAPLLLAVVFLLVGWYFLRGTEPDPPWRPVAEVGSVGIGEAREVLPGVFLGRVPDGRAFAVAEERGCPLRVAGGGYVDCTGTAFDLDGAPVAEGGALDLIPLRVHRERIYLDPTRRIER